MLTMQDLLREAADKGASDLHLSAGEPPLLRVHGDLVRIEHPAVTPEQVTELVNSIMSEAQRATFEAEHEVELAPLESGLHGIERVPGGWRGGADPRREGVAKGR